jgi:threonine/homoserine efflux transporter RhtA
MLEALYDVVILSRITRSYRVIQKNGSFVVAVAMHVASVHVVPIAAWRPSIITENFCDFPQS